MKRKTLLLVLFVLVGALSALAFNGVPKSYTTPTSSHTFSVVLQETGNINQDVAQYAAALRAQGWSEQEIKVATEHLRAAEEGERRDVSESHSFSVIVNADDVKGYVAALRKQGVSEATIQVLKDDFVKHQIMSPQTKDPCKVRTDGAEAYNAFHSLLYRYSSSIKWCYNGSVITYLNTWQQYSTYWGWYFAGSSYSQSGGWGQWSFNLHRYATMRNRVTGAEKHPSTHQSVYGNGYSWGTASSG